MYLTDQAVERVARDLQRTSSWKENALKKAKAREHEIRALLGVATGTLLFSFGDGAYAQAGKRCDVFEAQALDRAIAR